MIEDKFKGIEVCNASSDEGFFRGGTIEEKECLEINDARKKLISVYNSTGHDNRDTQTLDSVIQELDDVIRYNTKKDLK